MVLIHQQFLLVYSESQSKYPKLFEHQYSSLFHLFELYSRDQSLVLFVRSSFVPTLIAREYWVKQTVACVWLQYILYTLLLHNHIIVDYSCKQKKWENKLGRSELTPGWWWGHTEILNHFLLWSVVWNWSSWIKMFLNTILTCGLCFVLQMFNKQLFN